MGASAPTEKLSIANGSVTLGLEVWRQASLIKWVNSRLDARPCFKKGENGERHPTLASAPFKHIIVYMFFCMHVRIYYLYKHAYSILIHKKTVYISEE